MSISRPAGSDARRLIFVGGLHRSGTSLVTRLLGEHPDVSAFADTGVPEDEGQHLQDVYPTAAELGGPGRFGFRPGGHITEHSSLVSDASRDRLCHEWGRYWDLECPYLVEKSPPNLIRSRFLQALFPRSRFVMVMRHPVAVTCATEGWAASAWRPLGLVQRGPLAWTKTHYLIRHWVRCHQVLVADAPHVSHLLIVRYEDLVSDPQAQMAKVYDFLEIDAVPAEASVRSGINDAYFERWERRRRAPLVSEYVERVVSRYEPSVNDFGYSLSNLRGPRECA